MFFQISFAFHVCNNEADYDEKTCNQLEVVCGKVDIVAVAAGKQHKGTVNNRTNQNSQCLILDFILTDDEFAKHEGSKAAYNNAGSASYIGKS